MRRGGRLVCTYFDENVLGMLPAAHADGLQSRLDYYRDGRRSVQSKLLAQDHALYPVHGKFTGGSGCSGALSRTAHVGRGRDRGGLTGPRWTHCRAASRCDLKRRPRLANSPTTPGQHHVRISMDIAQARLLAADIRRRLGAIDPQERLVAPIIAV